MNNMAQLNNPTTGYLYKAAGSIRGTNLKGKIVKGIISNDSTFRSMKNKPQSLLPGVFRKEFSEDLVRKSPTSRKEIYKKEYKLSTEEIKKVEPKIFPVKKKGGISGADVIKIENKARGIFN